MRGLDAPITDMTELLVLALRIYCSFEACGRFFQQRLGRLESTGVVQEKDAARPAGSARFRGSHGFYRELTRSDIVRDCI